MADRRIEITFIGDERDLSRAFKNAGNDADTLDRKVGGIGDHMGKLGTGVGIAGAALGTGVAAAAVGLTALTAKGIESAGSMEQSRIAFEGLLGSAEAANGFIDQLKDFSASTPFEMPGLQEASRQLLGVGFGVEEVIPTLTRLGDVASTLGVGTEEISGVVRALGQMKGKGKASAEELQQISEQMPGFSAIGAIAESMGITTAEAFKKLESGAIPADTAIKAILDGMERFPGAAGAMERQSMTLNGMLSTFSDTINNSLVTAFEPMLPTIKEALGPIGEALGTALGAVAPVIVQVAQTILPPLAGLLTKIAPIIGKMVEALAPFIEQLAAALGPVIEQLAPVIGDVFSKLLTALTPVLPVLGQLLSAVIPLITPLADIVVLLIDSFVPILQPLVQGLTPVIQALADGLKPIIEQLKPHMAMMADLFSQLLVALLPMLPPIMKLVMAIVELAFAFMPLIDACIKPLIPLLVQMAHVLEVVVSWLADKLTVAVNWAIDHVKNFKDTWESVKDVFKGVINFLIDGWNKLDFGIHIKVPDWVPGVGGKGFDVDDLFPDIPRLHVGGTFDAPTPGGEGFALLRDGERVSTPGGGGEGMTVIVQGNLWTTDALMDELSRRVRSGGLALTAA